MKKPILSALVTMLLLSSIPHRSSAQVVNLDARAQQIQLALQSQRYDVVRAEAGQAIEDIYISLRPDNVVAEVQSKLNEIRNEVITSSRTETSQSSAKASLLSLFSASYSSSSSRHSEMTKIITANPQEVADFPAKIQRDFAMLRGMVVQYINSHLNDIILMKYLGILYFQAVHKSKMSGRDLRVGAGELQKIRTMLADLNFLGSQKIESCITTNYAATTNSSSSTASAALDLLIFKASGSHSESNVAKTFAHTAQTCSTPITNLLGVSTSQVWSINLTRMDEMLKQWIGTQEAIEAFSGDLEEFRTPTFGNRHFRQ